MIATVIRYDSCAAFLRAKGKLIDGATRVHPAPARRVLVADIQNAVAQQFGRRLSDLLGPRRNIENARPRQLAMYLCRIHTDRSLPDIGQRFGDRDHTTVVHAIKRIERLLPDDGELAENMRAIQEALGI